MDNVISYLDHKARFTEDELTAITIEYWYNMKQRSIDKQSQSRSMDNERIKQQYGINKR